jgi:hypothetical protein
MNTHKPDHIEAQGQFMPAIEQLQRDLETLLEQHPITSSWTLMHSNITKGLLETIVGGWRLGRQDHASMQALRSVVQDMNGSTATVFRASLDTVESWLETNLESINH